MEEIGGKLEGNESDGHATGTAKGRTTGGAAAGARANQIRTITVLNSDHASVQLPSFPLCVPSQTNTPRVTPRFKLENFARALEKKKDPSKKHALQEKTWSPSKKITIETDAVVC